MMTTYSAQGGVGSISFAGKFPGHIVPIDVAPGNDFMVHRHGFMAATPGVELAMGFQQSFPAASSAARASSCRRSAAPGAPSSTSRVR